LNVYADSSFLVSLYVTDIHSHSAHRLMVRRPTMWLTPFHRVEWEHAIAQNLFRRAFSNQEAMQFHSDFEADLRNGIWTEVEIPEVTFETASKLARKYVPRLGCRTLATLHVASARELGADEFWSFDERQLKLARAAGLKAT